MDYLKHKAGIQLSHKISTHSGAVWCVSWQDRSGSFMDYQSGTQREYPSFLIADLRFNYHIKRLIIYTEASNIFNTPYFDLGNVPLPGRWIKAGINFTFTYPVK
jgi:iron complex outermembrane receptor protein